MRGETLRVDIVAVKVMIDADTETTFGFPAYLGDRENHSISSLPDKKRPAKLVK